MHAHARQWHILIAIRGLSTFGLFAACVSLIDWLIHLCPKVSGGCNRRATVEQFSLFSDTSNSVKHCSGREFCHTCSLTWSLFDWHMFHNVGWVPKVKFGELLPFGIAVIHPPSSIRTMNYGLSSQIVLNSIGGWIDVCAEIRARVADHKPSDVPEPTGGGGPGERHWRAVLMASQHSHTLPHHSRTISG